MAWTVTKKEISVHGSDRVIIMSCTADAATQNIYTGLNTIYNLQVTPYSMATANTINIGVNSMVSGTAAVGYLGCTGFAANDQFCLVVYGR